MGDVASVESYDIKTDSWTSVASMTKPRTDAQAAVIRDSNDVIVCGGSGTDGDWKKIYHSDCESYNWNKNQWTVAEFSLNIPRIYHGLFASKTSAVSAGVVLKNGLYF